MGIENGAFLNMPNLEILRLDHNEIVEQGTFIDLPELNEIQMYRTKLNTTIFGTYDVSNAISKRTFAPNCPKLNAIELGTTRLRALYPNYFASDKFLELIRRVGDTYKTISTDIEECDYLAS